jgi:hypothetical protein
MLQSRGEVDVGIYNNTVEYPPTPHSISSIVMTLILVRDHITSRYVPLRAVTCRFVTLRLLTIRLLVHPALLALMSSMSYSGKVTLFERTYIS